jgi:hypothetical protein
MDLSLINKMEAPELRRYIEFLLWHYRVVDAFWYLHTVELFDDATADRLNEKVWSRVAPMAARDLVKRFEIAETGLAGVCKGLALFPLVYSGGLPDRAKTR